MELTRTLLEGCGALLLMFATFFLYRVSDKIEKLTDGIASLREELARDYVRNTEWMRIRDSIHDLKNDVSAIKARLYLEDERRKQPRN
jgi:hypothetical protein